MMFEHGTHGTRRRGARFAGTILAAAIAATSTGAFACDPDDDAKQKSSATFLRHVGDQGHGGHGAEVDVHMARLHEQLERLQSELDALRHELGDIGGHRGMVFAAPPPAPDGFFAPPKMPKMPKLPEMPEINWAEIPDVPELHHEIQEHVQEWQDHAQEFQEQAREWQREHAREWQDHAREWKREWQDHRRELAEHWREEAGEWREEQQEFAREWRDAAQEMAGRVRDRARDAFKRERNVEQRERKRAESRAKAERKERQKKGARADAGSKSVGDSVRIVYGVTGEHADMLYDLLAPSDVRVVVSRAGKNIGIKGNEGEHATLTAGLQLLNWIERDDVFESMRRGESINRKYALGEERAEILFDMLAPSEVRVIVSGAGDDAVSVSGTEREHEVLADFLELLHWRE